MNFSVHDNEIISYEVNLKNEEIIIQTISHWEKVPNVTLIFSGVLAHWFEHQLPGSIILDLEKRELDEFFEYNKELLEKSRPYSWPTDYKDLKELEEKLRKENYFYYLISAFYGLNGWVLAKKVDHT
ncbi:putative protein OS=Ureibacillus acetophenoni OX=614649 GN=SAMN05877842_12015 PE=4 SV=1 [Ureibacillus acetophenoni]